MLNRKRNDRNHTSHETSLIARGTLIRGDLRFSGALHLDGRIEGTVLGEGDDAMFTLSEHGQVHGEIRVPHAVINGHVTGDVYVSTRLALRRPTRLRENSARRLKLGSTLLNVLGKLTGVVVLPLRRLPLATWSVWT